MLTCPSTRRLLDIVRDKDVQVFAEENTYVQEKLSESNCRLGNIFVVDMTVTRRHLAT
jgi:hypothetical protein